MTWSKEKGLSTLIKNVSNEEQMEYNLGRSQLEVIGYSIEDFHKKILFKLFRI